MNKTIITFQADEQNLVKTSGVECYASDTVSYIEAQFTLGTNWTGYDSVRAMWRFGTTVIATVLDANGTCLVPHEVLTKRGELKVNLVGSIAEGDVLTDRLTSFPILALVISKIAEVEGDETAEVTPSQFEQYVNITNAGASRAEASAEQAEQSAQASAQSAQSASDSAENASQSAQSASQSAEEAEQASQSVLGLTATASVDSSVGTPSVEVTVSESGDHKVMDFDFHNLKGEQGEQGIQGEKGEQGERGETGASGADGFSPIVEVTPTEDGNEVTITDKNGEHTFEVKNGTVEDFYPFLPTDSAQGEIASFSDGANDVPVTDLLVNITPKQDLNGQASPYPAGGGANKLNVNNMASTGAATVQISNEKITVTWTNGVVFLTSKNVQTFEAGTYTLSITGSNTSKLRAEFVSVATNTTLRAGTPPLTYTAEEPFYITFYGDYTASDKTATFTAQLESGSTATPWSPYSNICPITGWTGASVQRTGVNVWDEEWEVGGIDDNTGRLLGEIDRIRSKNFDACVPNTTYYTIDPTNGLNMRVFWYDADKNFISRTAWVGNNSITSPSNACYFKFKMATAYGTTYNNDISINYPSTDASYHAYQGQTYPISWATEAGTVYGGTLDVTTGLLTVDRAMVEFNGTENFIENTSAWGNLAKLYNAGIQMTSSVYEPKTICSHFMRSNVGGWAAIEENAFMVAGSTYIGIGWNGTISDLKNYLTEQYQNGTPCQVVAVLQNSTIYQLSATEVRTLLGDNNIWADTGSTTVTYRADIQRYIDKQISAVLNA